MTAALRRVEAFLRGEPPFTTTKADLRAVCELARRAKAAEAAIRAADAHLERAIEWEPRPVEVVRGDAQLARAALRAVAPPRTTKRAKGRRG